VQFANVVGTIVCTVKTEGLVGHRLLLLEPTDSRRVPLRQPELVAVDLVNSAPGQWVFFVRAREAANAMPNPTNPVDAAILGIVDEVRRGP
jgi:ethanolamine utilization protein EutN